jgi:hypothetical protein
MWTTGCDAHATPAAPPPGWRAKDATPGAGGAIGWTGAGGPVTGAAVTVKLAEFAETVGATPAPDAALPETAAWSEYVPGAETLQPLKAPVAVLPELTMSTVVEAQLRPPLPDPLNAIET